MIARAAALALLLAATAMPALSQTPIPPRLACDALAGADLSADLGVPARVDAASIEAEGRPAPVCHLRGTIRGTIGFQAWLPMERWTGRYLQMGCGGLCGRVSTNAPQAHGCVPYERGEFATAATDMGHTDPSASSWGADPERREDFAHRAQHLTARAAKLLIARFYGEGPRRSYFSGCSDGGREGLMEALLHPEDFDGIAAGAPALDFTAQNTFHHAWTVQRNRRADGSAALTADRLPVLHRLVLTACGGADGVVADPLSCRFDPMSAVCAPGADPAGCLTEEEARAAAAIYDGPRTAAGERLTAGGLLPGSEANWRGTVAPEDASRPPRALLFATGVLRHLAFPPGAPTPAPGELAFDAGTLAQLAGARSTFDATATDLGPFFARGGRLLLWHGLADQDITPRTTVAWWGALRRDLGAWMVDEAARLYLIPGLAHCRGGVGLTENDTLTPLIRWVEEGVAPGDLAERVAPTGDVAPPDFLGAGRFGPRSRPARP
ncbi:tannase/feruloyl esterase family alpha/beta hydrolase [Muricoccus pecuniae]|uniref:Feruloyl esterase n=1 Tax=Muricoccus pecuniae TaxID=693023 RepID=A0A840YEQ2_9PROT|nr:tannase/feruloyl esterase family alpha/beta hydrolase [Roseomonas pecuniae]MBB5694681.1 feruloyl esterase [Roseomonas pecuniae]